MVTINPFGHIEVLQCQKNLSSTGLAVIIDLQYYISHDTVFVDRTSSAGSVCTVTAQSGVRSSL
jgi:hypothetical protein